MPGGSLLLCHDKVWATGSKPMLSSSFERLQAPVLGYPEQRKGGLRLPARVEDHMRSWSSGSNARCWMRVFAQQSERGAGASRWRTSRCKATMILVELLVEFR